MLTTIDNIKELPGMAENIRDKRIIPYLQEVEDAHILPAIGAELYEKLDGGEVSDATLVDGGYYTAGNERKLCHGIRKAVAYLAYSKMLRANKVSITAFGVSEKVGSYAHSANEDNVNYAANHNEKMGMFYLDTCIEYLNKDKSSDSCGASKPRGRFLAMEVIG